MAERETEMPWERKGGNALYYVRYFRDDDGRVRKEYLGRGPEAEEAARAVDERRETGRTARQAAQEERAAIVTSDRSFHDLRVIATALLADVLDRKGFHEHRGQWRKVRVRQGGQA